MKISVTVPKFLKYSLKVYGLNARQFLVFLIGSAISASTWESLSSKHHFLAFVVIAVSLIITAVIAFLRIYSRMLEDWIAIIFAWAILPNRLHGRSFLRTFQRIKTVRDDGIIEVDHAGYAAILRVKGCFFEQLENEQDFFLNSFSELLEGLTFPIHIVIQTRLITNHKDFHPSATLKKELRRLQAHYFSFLQSCIRNQPPRIMTCFIILRTGKHTQCFEQTRFIISALDKIEVTSSLLSSKEVSAFYHENFGGEVVAVDLNARDVCLEMKEGSHTYSASFVLSQLPGSLVSGWLARFIQYQEEPCNISLSIQPTDDQKMVSQLERKAAQFGGALLVAEKQGEKGNALTRHALKEMEELREQLLLRKSHLFATTMIVCVLAPSRTVLKTRTARIRLLLRSLSGSSTPLFFQHHLGLLSGLYGENLLPGYTHLLPTDAVASFYPFIQIPLLGNQGVLLGATRDRGDLVSLDLQKLMNMNLGVLGAPGSGKSVFLKVLSSRLAAEYQNLSVSIIDIEGEYRAWAEAVDAHQTFLSASSLGMNPFSLNNSHSLREKMTFLVGLLALLIGNQAELTPHEKALVIESIIKSYAAYGVTDDPATYHNPVPSMHDFINILKQLDPGSDLCYRLEMYLYLFPDTVIEESKSPYHVYNLHDLPADLRSVAMYLIIEHLSHLLENKEMGRRHLVIVDEAWFLARFALGASFLNEFARRARKYGVGLWVGTQQVKDLLAEQGEMFKGLLDLCATKVLFRQEVDIGGILKLSPTEEKFLHTTGRGQALYISSKERFMISVLASEHEILFARGANDEANR